VTFSTPKIIPARKDRNLVADQKSPGHQIRPTTTAGLFEPRRENDYFFNISITGLRDDVDFHRASTSLRFERLFKSASYRAEDFEIYKDACGRRLRPVMR